MNATDAVRSGVAAGRFVFGSRNENTNRFLPTACWLLTMTGMMPGLPATPDAPGDVAVPDDPDAPDAPLEPHAAEASATSTRTRATEERPATPRRGRRVDTRGGGGRRAGGRGE